jgi:carbamoyltransferase
MEDGLQDGRDVTCDLGRASLRRSIGTTREATLAERKGHTGGGGPVNVLGINSVYHESAAALLVDGALVAASEEERFNRIKHGKPAEFDNPHQLPERAIRSCLNCARLTAGDIGHVAYSFDPRLRRTRYRAEWWDPRLEEAFRLRLGQVRGAIEDLLGRSLGQRFHFVPHHRAHAASAYFLSGFDRAAILTIDGMGETAGSSLAKATGHRIRSVAHPPTRSSRFASLALTRCLWMTCF